jgi:hypothetical protein
MRGAEKGRGRGRVCLQPHPIAPCSLSIKTRRLSRHKRFPSHEDVGPSHLFHDHRLSIDNCARRDGPKRAIPPKTLSETSHDADNT